MSKNIINKLLTCIVKKMPDIDTQLCAEEMSLECMGSLYTGNVLDIDDEEYMYGMYDRNEIDTYLI